MNDTVCLSACPNNYFNISTICQICDTSCYSCLNISYNCTICASGYVMNGTRCTNNCQVGTVAYNGTCQCSSLCLTCTGVYDNCTSCNVSTLYKINYLNTCLSMCPVGTYINASSCTICPTGCSVCN